MIEAYGDRIVVTLKEAPQKKGELFLPNAPGDKLKSRGVVKFVGPDVENLKVGQEVIFNGVIGAFVEDGVAYSVMAAEHILVAIK